MGNLKFVVSRLLGAIPTLLALVLFGFFSDQGSTRRAL